MRRLLLWAALGMASLANAGCFVNIWSPDPVTRMEQLMYESENLRQIEGEWRRFWFTDQPSHMTPVRVHGGVGP